MSFTVPSIVPVLTWPPAVEYKSTARKIVSADVRNSSLKSFHGSLLLQSRGDERFPWNS